jgi:hypothetical protein
MEVKGGYSFFWIVIPNAVISCLLRQYNMLPACDDKNVETLHVTSLHRQDFRFLRILDF